MDLDDDYSGTSLTGIDEELKHPLAGRVVLCPVDVGLTVEHLPSSWMRFDVRLPKIRKGQKTSRRVAPWPKCVMPLNKSA